MNSGKNKGILPAEMSEVKKNHSKRNENYELSQEMSRIFAFKDRRKKEQERLLAEQIVDALNAVVSAFDKDKGVREIRANHRSITGWITGDTKSLAFESSIEMDFAYLALFDSRVTAIHAQPITFQYSSEKGHQRNLYAGFFSGIY